MLEKESAVATHQSGRNSGVLHSGIYYRPGSLKALNCRAGKQAMQEFCTRVLWLNQGSVAADGAPHVVVARYRDETANPRVAA